MIKILFFGDVVGECGVSLMEKKLPQLTKIDLAVLPETKSQGLFNQIHKEVTFCGLPHEADA